MTKRQRSFEEEETPMYYSSRPAGMKDFTVKVLKEGSTKPEYILQRASRPSLAVKSIQEAFPGCRCLVIDSREVN